LNRHPPETPAILDFWQTPLIGGCEDLITYTAYATILFSHDGREKPKDYSSETAALKVLDALSVGDAASNPPSPTRYRNTDHLLPHKPPTGNFPTPERSELTAGDHLPHLRH
jgi:hypothetical protein